MKPTARFCNCIEFTATPSFFGQECKETQVGYMQSTTSLKEIKWYIIKPELSKFLVGTCYTCRVEIKKLNNYMIPNCNT